MSLTKVTYSMIDAPVLNLKDYGAVGDGISNDTAAWIAFITACSTNGYKGIIPAGVYLIDPYTFNTTYGSGIILEGESWNPAAPPPSIPGHFGAPISVIRLRSASPQFLTFAGAYYMQFKNLHIDGNQFADSVLYYTGVENNNQLSFDHCEFYGATPTTGSIHRYAGTSGGDTIKYYFCVLSNTHNRTDTSRSAYCINNTNTNAFLIDYEKCTFASANIIARYAPGSCNLYDCQFFNYTSACISIDSICQPFLVTGPYTEQTPNLPFFIQQGISGVTTYYPITIINAINNSVNASLTLNCQQPVHIYGGFFGGNINVNPMPTYGTMANIIDGAAFNTGYGIIGTGAVTRVITRNCSVNFVPQASIDYGALPVAKYTESINAGATISVTNETWINVSNSGAQNVTGLTGGLVGQQVILYFSDGNTTLVNSGTLKLQGSTNVTPTTNSVITFIGSGAAPGLTPAYYSEVSRSIK
jgi:hypothetical protein